MATTLNSDTAEIYQQIVADPRTAMSVRVGIAGSRNLTSEGKRRGEKSLTHILSSITDVLDNLIHNSDIAKRLYKVTADSKPLLRLTSSLAIGADRMFMHPPLLAAITEKADIEFAAILPFLPEKCEIGYHDDSRSEATNQADWQDFQDIFRRVETQKVPRILAIDGDLSTTESRDMAYYRCSEYLAENIDLLIVITEGDPAPQATSHVAGSAATIKQARDLGRPVIHIIVNREDEPQVNVYPARKIVGQTKYKDWSESIVEEMMQELVLFRSILEPTISVVAEQSNSQDKQRRDLILNEFDYHINDRDHLKFDLHRDSDFSFSGPIHTPISWLEKLRGFKAYDWFIALAARKAEPSQRVSDTIKQAKTIFNHEQSSAESAMKHQIFAHFLRADGLAIKYADIHRSTYLLIYVFAASALITAAVALTFQKYMVLVAFLISLESTFLVLIYWLYKQDHHNHRRWLQNRCLAEAIRPNIYLNPLGRCFSFMLARSSGEFLYREVLGHQESGAQWVCIQAEMINRQIGFGRCIYDPSRLRQVYSFITDRWLTGQISYHQSNASIMQGIGERLSKATHALFFLTATALLLKAGFYLAEHYGGWPVKETAASYYAYKAASLLTAVFPILGTAIFAIRNHSELDISEQRSRTMLAILNSVLHNLTVDAAAVFNNPERPGVVQATSAVFDTDIERLSEVSVEEVSEWLEIYEVKESEPG